jgi:hypothetical protein
MVSARLVPFVCAAAVLGASCEKSSRTRNSGGSTSLTDDIEQTPLPVYNFVTAEQSLRDARGAVSAEKWGEAQVAAQALLDKQPENAEAIKLRDRAKAELANQTSFARFAKAAASADGVAMAKAWRDIAEESIYKERGRPQFERVKAGFLDAQANEATRLAHVGRCDDARRVARTIADYFPDAHERFDAIPAGCRPGRDDKSAREVASLERGDRRSEREAADTSPPVEAPAPEAKAAVVDPAAASPAQRPAIVDVPPPPASPRKIAQGELESLRVAGARFPSLPAGARTIAHRDGVKTVQMAAEVCVGENGAMSSVRLLRGSDYNDANDKVVADIKEWRFRPYVVDGKPIPVCAPVILRYSIE